jgi:hypothetical protein
VTLALPSSRSLGVGWIELIVDSCGSDLELVLELLLNRNRLKFSGRGFPPREAPRLLEDSAQPNTFKALGADDVKTPPVLHVGTLWNQTDEKGAKDRIFLSSREHGLGDVIRVLPQKHALHEANTFGFALNLMFFLLLLAAHEMHVGRGEHLTKQHRVD